MKNIFIDEREIKEPKLAHAIFSFFALVAVMSVGIIIFKVDPHIPMFAGVIVAAIVAMTLGYKWETIEKMMIDGIGKAMQSILILAIVGMMVGVWLLSGTIPTMIYYGLKLLSPKIFLVAAVLICSITSLATGTSWGTMGTMGLALMGIGHGLGMPIGPTAGAVLAGAYFGDKMSPLSDTTNLAPAMAGTDVFSHVKYMLKSTIVAYVISLVFFGIYGFLHASTGDVDTSQAQILMDGLAQNFNISPILLLPPLVVILAIAFKVPAIPGITLGLITGAILAPFFQSGANFGAILDCSLNGFVCETDVAALNDLLSTGGLMNMASSILMTVIAMMFGGIMEDTGQLAVIIDAITKRIKTAAGLVGATELTCILSNVVMPEQYISILVPGRMYAPAYRKAGLHPKCLSNALESAGTVTSCLVPWNTCGMFIMATLGVSTLTYAPWAVFNYLMPIVTLVMAYMGFTVTKMTDEEQARADAGKIVS
ncbi:MAG: Na+/H+ antiporter NhaC [Clostridiales bacterium]|nr:Na+/H+ antiporter NhaC [Candidatus Crickella equi]